MANTLIDADLRKRRIAKAKRTRKKNRAAKLALRNKFLMNRLLGGGMNVEGAKNKLWEQMKQSQKVKDAQKAKAQNETRS